MCISTSPHVFQNYTLVSAFTKISKCKIVVTLAMPVHYMYMQGQYDILDGPASNSAWIDTLAWPGQGELSIANSTIWTTPGPCWEEARTGTSRSPSGATATMTTTSVSSGGESSLHHRQVGSRSERSIGVTRRGSFDRHDASDSQCRNGWWRSSGRLTHTVVYRAGHMVPHDQAVAAEHMLHTWMMQAMDHFS